MTAELTGATFEDVRIFGNDRTLGQASLTRCTFVGCSLAQSESVVPGLVVSDVKASRCTVETGSALRVRFENVEIDHLTVKNRPLQLRGCVFSRVKLTGNIGPILAWAPPPLEDSAENDAALLDLYASIDWALDISEASFTEAEFWYVPGDLVRRDPETQFLLRRERFADVDPAALPNVGRVALAKFETVPFDSMVFVAPTRSKYVRRYLDGLSDLRKLGLAE